MKQYDTIKIVGNINGKNWIEKSKTINDKIGNGFKFAGKLLRFTTGVLTAPVVLSLEIASKSMP